MPYSASTPRSPRLDNRDRRIGNLRAANAAGACALHQVAHTRHQLVERELIGIMQCRRRQPATANGNRDADMHRLRRFEFVVAIEPVEGGKAACGQGDRFDGERADQQPVVGRQRRVLSAPAIARRP